MCLKVCQMSSSECQWDLKPDNLGIVRFFDLVLLTIQLLVFVMISIVVMSGLRTDRSTTLQAFFNG